MQMFVTYYDFLSEDKTNFDKKLTNNTNEKHLILEEDLLVNSEGKYFLFIRFKNCTGNLINLSKKQTETGQTELA